MDDLFQERQKILALCLERLEDVRIRGLEIWGPALGAADTIVEDVMILEEIKGQLGEAGWREFVGILLHEGDRMPTEKETQLYFEARNRCLERQVDRNNLLVECTEGFKVGIAYVASLEFDPPFGTSRPDDEWLKAMVEKIKSESNFGFGFVCGVLARMEAVKGKGYQASWQRRGEAEGALVNVERKFDRLEAVTRANTQGETKSQVLGDLAVYCIKWLTLRSEMDPAEFMNWVKEVQNL